MRASGCQAEGRCQSSLGGAARCWDVEMFWSLYPKHPRDLSVLNMKSPQLDPGDGFDGQREPDPSIAADDPWPTFLELMQ